MPRLIDANAFEVFRFTRKSEDFADGVLYVLEKIDEAPTVDAVSVCQLLGKQMEKDDYCSYGERRDEE